MKILGIQFDYKLDWGHHIDNMTKKSNIMLSGLKTTRGKLTEEQFLKMVTSQYFGVINYGIPVWYTPLLKDKYKQRLSVLHYKPLRLTIKDYSREMLDTIGRAKPDRWALYATALLIHNVRSIGAPVRLAEEIMKNEFRTRRSKRPQHFDESKKE